MRALVVDDDPFQLEAIRLFLSEQYQVDTASDGRQAYTLIKQGAYDFVVLDLNMPVMDGMALCKRLRAEDMPVPIIMVTASQSAPQCVAALNAGADDYVTKPLHLSELHARIKALLRRTVGNAPQSQLLVGGLRLDVNSRTAYYRQSSLKLTPREYSLLELFMRYPGRVFSRPELISRLWEADSKTMEESVKAHVKGLRQKLEKAAGQGLIETVYGMGYRLNPE